MAWRIVLTLAVLPHLALSLEREMTVHVDPGKEECFFESVPASNTLTVEYQVIDGGSGQMAELDINFRIVNPKGQPIFAEFKKPDGSHTYKSEVSVDILPLFETRVSSCFLSRKLEITKFVSTTSFLTSAQKQSILKYST